VSYNNSDGPINDKTITGAMNVTLPVIGGVTYWLSVKAVTIKEGNQSTKEVQISVYGEFLLNI
jgi:hypothetical protein